MSLYQPKTTTVVEHADGYWVHDSFGPLDGPYTRRDAYAVADQATPVSAPPTPVSAPERNNQ